MMPPAKLVVADVPEYPVATLRAVLADDDVGSPYYQSRVPLISLASAARCKMDGSMLMRALFLEVRRAVTPTDPTLFIPVLVCVVRPALFSDVVRDELFAGLDQTNCDFVVFEEADKVPMILGNLPPETTLLEPENPRH
jgi:hypothetical protein